MAKRPRPAPKLLRQLIDYDPLTGALTWLHRPSELFEGATPSLRQRNCRIWNERYAGKPALIGMDRSGYFQGTVFGQNLKAHYVAWAIHNDEWPSRNLSHRDGDHGNNRIWNLVVKTHAQSRQNARRSKANTSGVTGAYWNEKRGKWQATIQANGKVKHLGYFDDIEDAADARRVAEIEAGFDPRHGRARKENKYIPSALRRVVQR